VGVVYPQISLCLLCIQIVAHIDVSSKHKIITPQVSLIP
jgi:hypothetical protein